MDEIDFRLFESCIKYETGTFSPKQLQRKMGLFGTKVPLKTLRQWLDGNPSVFKLEDDLYITKSGCFTGRQFGIKPTKYEVDHNILIVGHRCVPFIDGDIYPFEIKFIFDKKLINYTTKNVMTSEMIHCHKIFGDENFLQYVMFDPVNEGKDFSFNGFELPSMLECTVLDMTEFYQRNDFQYEDWIRATVTSFPQSIVSLEADCRHRLNPFEQSVFDEKKEEWNKKFEETFVENLHKFGPCSCIEEQLMLHFVNSMYDLSVPDAGSVEEFLKFSEKIGFSEFGVESRLWILNEDISDSKNWASDSKTEDESLFQSMLGLQIPDAILDAYIYDALFKKEEDYSKIIERIYEADFPRPFEIDISNVLLKNRFPALQKKYNWFADYEKAVVREQALKVFKKTHDLFKRIESSKTDVDDYPQQDFVIFIQLYSHVQKMIESLNEIDELDQASINAALSSLEGMNFTFEEIKGGIQEVLRKGPWNKN